MHPGALTFSFYLLKGRKTETSLPATSWLPEYLPQPGTGQGQKPETQCEFPTGVGKLNKLSHSLLPPRECFSRMLELQAEPDSIPSTQTWVASVPSSVFTTVLIAHHTACAGSLNLCALQTTISEKQTVSESSHGNKSIRNNPSQNVIQNL